ncbi:MAG: hypothetical protein N0E56_15875 [Candidatus Thiodiazotropha endolucinida]|nr:hypothetical protein [Candidatus Thiodiazotropha taylori]MCW4268102.1 hypothetical protein [Candidatus Thiodiazotropha endolucinida]
MKHSITELCLTSGDGVTPFAVLIEQDEQCVWAMPSRLHAATQEWLEHLLEGKQRYAKDWWVLEAWHDWLSDVSDESPENRRSALERMEMSTPGCVVRRPRAVPTRLPAGAVATRWCRDRLFNRAELIAAHIAENLAVKGHANWQSSVMVDDHFALEGDWIVEVSPTPGIGNAASGLALINVIERGSAESIKTQWDRSQAALGDRYPYGVAVVRGWPGAEVLDSGCLVGDHFAAPASLAIAAVRAKWGGSSFTQSDE